MQRTEEDYAIEAAVKRIHAKYGSDLGAFFKDVQAELDARAAERDLALRKKYGLA